MGPGRSYINLSELVNDKQEHTYTQLWTQCNISSLWNDKQGYMVRQTDRQIRWMGRWSITDIQTSNKTGSCVILVWQISSVKCSGCLISIQSFIGIVQHQDHVACSAVISGKLLLISLQFVLTIVFFSVVITRLRLHLYSSQIFWCALKCVPMQK